MASVTVELTGAIAFGNTTVQWGDDVSVGTLFSRNTFEQVITSFRVTIAGALQINIIGFNYRFTDAFEASGRIILTSSAGEVLEVVGTGSDTTEVYDWTPTNAAEVTAFYNHILGLDAGAARNVTLTLTDEAPVIPVTSARLLLGAAEVAAAYLGAIPIAVYRGSLLLIPRMVAAPATPWDFFVSQPGDFAIRFTALPDVTDRYQYFDSNNDMANVIAAHPSTMFGPSDPAVQRIGRLWHSDIGGTDQHVHTHRRGGGIAWGTFLTTMGNSASVYIINETSEEYIIFDMSDSVDGGVTTRPDGFNAAGNYLNYDSNDVDDQLIATQPSGLNTETFLSGLASAQIIFAFSRQRAYRPYA